MAKRKIPMIREAVVSYVGTLERSPNMVSSRDVSEFIAKINTNTGTEKFWCISVNSRNSPIAWELIAQGGPAFCAVSCSQIFRTPILQAATGILLAHNHPSGDPEPSEEDFELTRRIKIAADALGIRLLDHIIVADDPYGEGLNRYYSMLDHGDLITRGRSGTLTKEHPMDKDIEPIPLKITTNHQWREFKRREEVPPQILSDQFDWTDKDHEAHGDYSDGFILYRGFWSHLGDYMSGIAPEPWHGACGDSFFSGTLIQLSEDGERYKIGFYTS